MTGPGPMTARLYPAGRVYFSRRRGRCVEVPHGMTAVVCECCEYELNRPIRLGDADTIRRTHLVGNHWREIVDGSVVISESPNDWEVRMLTGLRAIIGVPR